MTRFAWLMATYTAAMAAVVTAPIHPMPRLIWNATASTPVGLYAVQPLDHLAVGDLVALQPPAPVAHYLAEGGFLPEGVLLLKHIAALPGQVVCRVDHTITVDGRPVGEARDRDSRGRVLPAWSGCQSVRFDHVFVMNPAIPDSLDGRYFGPLPLTSLIGRAIPLWTDEAGKGRFAWHADAR